VAGPRLHLRVGAAGAGWAGLRFSGCALWVGLRLGCWGGRGVGVGRCVGVAGVLRLASLLLLRVRRGVTVAVRGRGSNSRRGSSSSSGRSTAGLQQATTQASHPSTQTHRSVIIINCKAHEAPLRAMVYTHNGSYLLMGDDAGTLKIFKRNLQVSGQVRDLRSSALII